MCNPLTVSCLLGTSGFKYATYHELELPELIIPCTTPGSPACRAGIADVDYFYNPPTSCAGKLTQTT